MGGSEYPFGTGEPEHPVPSDDRSVRESGFTELGAASWIRVGANRVRLLRDGIQILPAMLQAIARAREEILLEFYWWAPDGTGTRFRDALVDQARKGVRVRAIYDSVGSLWTDDAFLEPLIEAGGEVVEYHPVSPVSERFRLDRVFLRDHRKLLVVDGELGFTGGANLTDAWAPEAWGGENWRDDALAVRGPAARELRAVFYDTWRRCGYAVDRSECTLALEPTMDVWVLANRLALGSRRRVRRMYLDRIRNARHQIDIANAYFVPDGAVRRALVHAHRRGVQVRVLVPEEMDVPVVELATEHVAAGLSAAGVQIWLYPDRMMHSKTAVIDHSFVTVGSFNLDRLSLRYNLECNLAVVDEHIAARVRRGFERDLLESVPFLERRRARSAWRRALGWAAYQLRPLL